MAGLLAEKLSSNHSGRSDGFHSFNASACLIRVADLRAKVSTSLTRPFASKFYRFFQLGLRFSTSARRPS